MTSLAARIALVNPDALLFEPRDVYDPCIVAIGHRSVNGPCVAVYDYERLLRAVQAHLSCDDEEAAEWVDYNMDGAWMGENTPRIRHYGEGPV